MLRCCLSSYMNNWYKPETKMEIFSLRCKTECWHYQMKPRSFLCESLMSGNRYRKCLDCGRKASFLCRPSWPHGWMSGHQGEYSTYLLIPLLSLFLKSDCSTPSHLVLNFKSRGFANHRKMGILEGTSREDPCSVVTDISHDFII